MICSYAFLLIFNKNTLNTHYIWRGRIPLLQIESRKHVYWTWKRTQCYLFNSVCGNLNPQAQPRRQGAFPWLFLPPHLQRQGKAPWGRGCPRPRMFKRRIACAKRAQACATCLVPRRLSFDENVRAKEGGKETTGPSHAPLRFITSNSFRARLCHARKRSAWGGGRCATISTG